MTATIDLDTLPDTRTPRPAPPQHAQRDSDRSAAFHEAGHAVIGLLNGMSLARTHIRYVHAGDNLAITGATTWNPSNITCGAYAAVAAAGAVADARYLRTTGLPADAADFIADSPHDRDKALALCTRIACQPHLADPGPDGTTGWDVAVATARADIDRLWPQITAVAEAILAAPVWSLTGDQVADLIGLPNPAPAAPAL